MEMDAWFQPIKHTLHKWHVHILGPVDYIIHNLAFTHTPKNLFEVHLGCQILFGGDGQLVCTPNVSNLD